MALLGVTRLPDEDLGVLLDILGPVPALILRQLGAHNLLDVHIQRCCIPAKGRAEPQYLNRLQQIYMRRPVWHTAHPAHHDAPMQAIKILRADVQQRGRSREVAEAGLLGEQHARLAIGLRHGGLG